MHQNKNQIVADAVRPQRQWKTRAISSVMIAVIALTGMMMPAMAEARGHKHHHHHKHKHKHHHHHYHKEVVIVKERPRHHHHHHYHKSRLPEIATFAVIAGVTYAIIDNQFYKRRGDNYEYVAKPR